jgi:hypothetical protein
MDREDKRIASFDCNEAPAPPHTPASPRPPDRPRVVEEAGDGSPPSLQLFDCEDIPLPPHTPATPRPTGRERRFPLVDGNGADSSVPRAEREPETP